MELARARRRYRAGPGLEYGGAGQSSETVELFRGSEMAKLAGARRRRNLLGLGDSGAGKSSKMTEAGQGWETAELPRGSETVELVCGPKTTELTSDQGSETVEMARARRWRSWAELEDGLADPGRGSERAELINQNMTRRNMETAMMARARRGQSGQGSELARAGHSAVKLLRRLFTLRELWRQFCV